jgi:Pentapeptide repeats (8 copies)
MAGSTNPEGGNISRYRKWYETRVGQIFIAIAIVLGYVAAGIILYLVLDKYIKPQTSAQKKDLVQALGLIMAGLGGAIGLFFTWQNTRQARASTHATLRLTEQGQITDRFTKAIDQLGEVDSQGEPRLEIRIGGIYALERIAKYYQEYSPEDYGPVMEVLAAYIRENAKRTPNQASRPTLKAQDVSNFLSLQFLSGARGDIQAALDVIGRRQEEHMPEEYRVSLDLQKTDLSGTSLVGANLSGADLTQTNLSGAFLHKANLSRADLSGADLSGAVLSGANFSGATLYETFLEGATLSTVVLSGHELHRISRILGLKRPANNRMEIEGADMRGAEELSQAQLEWTIGDRSTQAPLGLQRPQGWSEVDPYIDEATFTRDVIEQIRRLEERLKQEHGDGR